MRAVAGLWIAGTTLLLGVALGLVACADSPVEVVASKRPQAATRQLASSATSVNYDASLGTLPEIQSGYYFENLIPRNSLPYVDATRGVLYQNAPSGAQDWQQPRQVGVDFMQDFVAEANVHIISSAHIPSTPTVRSFEGWYLIVGDKLGRTFQLGVASNGYTINSLTQPAQPLRPFRFADGKFHRLRVVIHGGLVNVFFDGVEVEHGLPLAPLGDFGQRIPPITVIFGAAAGNTALGSSETELKTFCYGTSPTDCSPGLTIDTPDDTPEPRSEFIALTGRGRPNATLNVLVDGRVTGSVLVDPDGNWEAMPYYAFNNFVTVSVQDAQTLDKSNEIVPHWTLGAVVVPGSSWINQSTSHQQLVRLRRADVLIAGSSRSPQRSLYGATYTHTALYLGGDANGTPMIAEAVTESQAAPLGGQQIRGVPLEWSTIWAEDDFVAAFRPKLPLEIGTRQAIVDWTATVTNRGLPYWDTRALVSLINSANSLYVFGGGILSPRANLLFTQLNSLKYSTTTFICSTLVWRAYLEGTGHTLDISTPNLMSAQPGSVVANLPIPFRDAFIQNLASVFVVPETFVRSPKLSQIF